MLSPRSFTVLCVLLVACCPLLAVERSHPYLFFNADDLEAMRQRVADGGTVAADGFARLLSRVPKDYAIAYPPLDGDIREDWSRLVGRTGSIMRRAAFAWLITGERRYFDLASKTLLDLAEHFDARVNFHRWSDRSYMRIYFTGTLALEAAWTYDMLYNDLTDAQRRLVEDELLGGIVEMIRSIPRHAPSDGNAYAAADYEWGPGQWNGVMYCNSGIAAIGFALDDPTIYEHAVDNFRTYLARDILGDGLYTEEDWVYASFCMTSLMTVAEAAYRSGYPEDLFNLAVASPPADQWDQRYGETYAAEGPVKPTRTLRDYFDAIVQCQYPDLSPNNLGWQKNRARFRDYGSFVTLYELAWRRFKGHPFGWVVGRMDRRNGRGNLLDDIGPILLADETVGDAAPPASVSRIFNHGRWLVLKSIEGPDYWDSDAMYVFMPYGPFRAKGLARLSLDLFAYGRVLAPRVNKVSRDQSHDHPWYLHDDSWNNLMVDGENISIYRNDISATQMRFADLDTDLKAAQAVLTVDRRIRPSIWDDRIAERREDLDYRMGRTLLMTSDYLLDVMHVRFERPQDYLHSFTWNFHGSGDLTLDGASHDSRPKQPFAAIWRQADGVGLKTTVLEAPTPDSHKVRQLATPLSEYITVERHAKRTLFAAVHEPFRGDSRLERIEKLWQDDLALAVRIERPGRYVDILCVNCDADGLRVRGDGFGADVSGPYAYWRLADGVVTVKGEVASFTMDVGTVDVSGVILNGKTVNYTLVGGSLVFGKSRE